MIHKIYIKRNRIIPYTDARVSGTVNNQFSLDEYGSVLRIATTTNDRKGQYNNVFCLDYFLNVFGKLSNIAPG